VQDEAIAKLPEWKRIQLGGTKLKRLCIDSSGKIDGYQIASGLNVRKRRPITAIANGPGDATLDACRYSDRFQGSTRGRARERWSSAQQRDALWYMNCSSNTTGTVCSWS